MTNSLKQLVLNHITVVYNHSAESKLENSIFEILDEELSFLAEYFHTSKPQALFLAIALSLCFNNDRIDFHTFNSHFRCNPIKLLEYNEEFENLFEKMFFIKNSKRRKYKNIDSNIFFECFIVNEIILNRILKSEPIPEDLNTTNNLEDIFDLLENLYELCNQRDENELTTWELFKQAQTMLDEYTHFPLIEKTKTLGFNIEDRYIFLYLIWKFIDGVRNTWVQATFKEIYDRPTRRLSQIQQFLSKENELVKDNWIELEDTTFVDDSKMKLTDKSLDLLIACDIKLFNKEVNKKKDNIILPEQIPYRQLIYSSLEAQQIDVLKTLFKGENLTITQERLAQKALPKGITVLLHGVPGTGKTESVLQIAKETKREIIKVDISASRSMWFGESEKIIKQVFKDYKSYAATQTLAPILFFNEADAILSKRKQGISSNVSDTENRIQNILLEEIENFEGILMATTNLTNNLDQAFERRFLFKIEFQKPTIAVKAQIWKQKMPQLSDEDCELLAQQYDFSGGQIDNIVRKSAIVEILHNKHLTSEILMRWCDEEILNYQASKKLIGF